MFYVSGFNFDASDLTNDADIDGTVVSGTATFSNSQNSGKSFDMGSAVVNINAGENTGIGKYNFPIFSVNGHIIEFELKIDANATDGVILACDELNSDRAVWAISLIDTATTPKLKFCGWSEEEESHTSPTHQTSFEMAVPAGNGWNHYQIIIENSLYHRVNGGTQSSASGTPLQPSQWNNPSGNSVSFYEFEIDIGRSQYGTLATNNTLSTGASATNCHLDWFFIHPRYTNGLDRIKTYNTITDQAYPEAKYFYGSLTLADIIEIPSIKEPSIEAVELLDMESGYQRPGEFTVVSTTAEPISIGPVVEAGDTQKEFWS